MEGIIYRQIRKSDYEEIKDLINVSFFIEDYVENDKVLDLELDCELYEALVEQSYTCIAEKDGKVVGVLMGQAKSDYSVFRHLDHYIKYYSNLIKWRILAFLKKDRLADSKKINETYDYFLENSKEEYDGVLSLFIVSEEVRGCGIGKELIRKFKSYLNNEGVEKIYLFTDSFCNYEFYDHLGFKRKNKKIINYLRNNKRNNLDIYLYSYEL
ncbi:GNAT family N-acetyltransferase [Peptoniphilus stercorisuis]|uniref:N-acetyltransferase YhbS n=1 Tax=Peptoniphilus stercorisuis TaxID=1436965 RepID=A0ABS4KBM8_9FIRM|nr:GNAT family N-acetyltransferase [Peptoniphilus stercorisuis]MBP2024651.1 putative N-acetyltransferase YhbS [Peptoniphilus stercorisuis]